MNKKSGFSNSYSIIKEIHFPKGKISVSLTDGRIIILPLGRFPEIARLKPSQKRKHKILAGMGLMFDDIDTVFHVSDFLGKVQTEYPVSENSKQTNLSQVAESGSKYKVSEYKFSKKEKRETYRRSKELKSEKVKGLSHEELIKSVRKTLKK